MMKIRRELVFVCLGMVLISLGLILKHFFDVSDLLYGLINGVSIGIMIFSIAFRSRRKNGLKSKTGF